MKDLYKDKINVWYLHPYAGGPNIGRFSRPYYLSRNWNDKNIHSTIFCPSFHHLLDEPRKAGPINVSDVDYHFLESREYANNGIARLANMCSFTFKMLKQANQLALKHGAPDVVIGSSPHPYVFMASHRIARRFGALSIFEVRDLWPLSLVELAGVNPSHPLVTVTGWLEKYAYKHADFTVSLHPHTDQYMQSRGLNPDSWRYIPNGVDESEAPSLIPEEPAYNRLRDWQSEGKFVILYAGALGPPNNIDVLVKAAAKLRLEDEQRIRILIVGRGENQTQVSNLISELDLRDHVGLYPQVPKSHALALMKAADAGYISLKPMPIFRHGISPNKLYDYMLSELPVISAIEAANDPVTDANCGMTIPPGDVEAAAGAFRRMSEFSSSELKILGRNGKVYVQKNHFYRNLANEYAKLFIRY